MTTHVEWPSILLIGIRRTLILEKYKKHRDSSRKISVWTVWYYMQQSCHSIEKMEKKLNLNLQNLLFLLPPSLADLWVRASRDSWLLFHDIIILFMLLALGGAIGALTEAVVGAKTDDIAATIVEKGEGGNSYVIMPFTTEYLFLDLLTHIFYSQQWAKKSASGLGIFFLVWSRLLSWSSWRSHSCTALVVRIVRHIRRLWTERLIA